MQERDDFRCDGDLPLGQLGHGPSFAGLGWTGMSIVTAWIKHLEAFASSRNGKLSRLRSIHPPRKDFPTLESLSVKYPRNEWLQKAARMIVEKNPGWNAHRILRSPMF